MLAGNQAAQLRKLEKRTRKEEGTGSKTHCKSPRSVEEVHEEQSKHKANATASKQES